jgi:hypothetical protein
LQLSASLVDWPEITFRERSGPLPGDFCNIGMEEGWIEDPPDDWCNSSIIYQSIFTTWLKIRKDLDAENQKHANGSFDLLLGVDSPYELTYPMECWFLAISPTTVESVSAHLEAFNSSPLEKLFEKHCVESDLDYIESYQDGFYPYLMQWKAVVGTAKKMGWGILGHCG